VLRHGPEVISVLIERVQIISPQVWCLGGLVQASLDIFSEPSRSIPGSLIVTEGLHNRPNVNELQASSDGQGQSLLPNLQSLLVIFHGPLQITLGVQYLPDVIKAPSYIGMVRAVDLFSNPEAFSWHFMAPS